VSDRVREGLFSSLGDRVPGARALDLYAGTGAVGIEALSRGAAEAVFVERDARAVEAIRSNLSRTGLEVRARVVRSDVERFVERAGAGAGAFDLVLLDPPYEVGPPELDAVIAALDAKALLSEGFTVVLTRGSRSSTPVIPVHWTVTRRLAYGDSVVTLFR
jgi:16S rRNA (guanine966-N2)-methyltransferase